MLQILLLVRERRVDANEEYDIFTVNLKKNFNSQLKKKPVMANVSVEDVGQLVARLKVFTTPMSVFSEDDNLTVSACYLGAEQIIYVLISNTAFSLLYRVEIAGNKKTNMALNFEQIITIKSATSLHYVNKNQLLAVSNTNVVLFQRDPTECDDMKVYFTDQCSSN